MAIDTPSEQGIGVFDSGLGGLTVAAAIGERLPHEPLVYLGDTARVPYGTRSPATVVRYARNNAAFLHDLGVKLIVVACNTVSAHALGGLADGATTPLLGVIRPGARAALQVSKGGAIAVLGTEGTVRSGTYELAVHELDPSRKVVQIACPLFVPLAEEGWADHPVAVEIARVYLSELEGSGVDTVVLGCTHYPLLRACIAQVLTEVLPCPPRVVDSASAVAAEVERFLKRSGLEAPAKGHPGRRRFFVTDEPERLGEVAARFWGGELLAIEHVDLGQHSQ